MVAIAYPWIEVILCSQNTQRVEALIQGNNNQASFRSMETLPVAQRYPFHELYCTQI